MVFSEPTFLFLFLPVLLGIHFVAPGRLRNVVLLAASLCFYAWGEGLWVGIMLGSIALNFGFGRIIEARAGSTSSRVALWLAVASNLAALVAFKYANFIADNVDTLLASLGLSTIDLEPVHLPIGISFFTFQAMSYVIDVHRGHATAQRNPLDLALYISLFPQLIAGPIVRYEQIADQLRHRVTGIAGASAGVQRFVVGLSKKVLIANPCGARADEIFALAAGDLTGPTAWLGLICYTFQIYFDFSGYSDMAIGLGRMFGFSFPENFEHPYVSRSITEFWRRWHISLSTWFRDYLYIPLGGNRGSAARTYRNLLVVFVLCGFWHGASWNFLIWGLLHGALLVVERVGLRARLSTLPVIVGHAYVLFFAMIAWVFFRAETLSDSMRYLAAMFGLADVTTQPLPVGYYLGPELSIVLVVATIGSTPVAKWIRLRLSAAAPAATGGLRFAVVSVLLLLSVTFLSAGTYNPFIYFRF